MTTPLLEIRNISKHYRTGETVVKALDNISLTIWPGEFIAIMGQSGSGKSTLMNIIGCLDKPSSGNYEVLGREVANLSADELAALRRETFGFVFQRYNLLSTVSAAENVEIPAIYAGIEKQERIKRSHALLTSLGIGDRADHRPTELSGGQQQRVAIARALMNNPPVILADEPTGALDSRSGEEVMALLKKLHSEGRTIILITHDENVAANAERIIKIHDGKIIEDAIPETHEIQNNTKAEVKELTNAIPNLSEAIKMALRSLRVNMFRTALTLLGIVIGVASVVTLLAVGNGSKQDVLNQISKMGTNLVSIRPGAPGIRSSGDMASLVVDDAEAIRTIRNVEMVVPERSGSFTLRHGNTDLSASVQGVGEKLPEAKDWYPVDGSFFTESDVKSYAPVAVIGKTVADTFFPDGDYLGKYLLIKNVPFEVIGLMSTKGAGFGGDQDNTVFVPYTTGSIRLFGKTYLNSITVRVKDTVSIAETQEEIKQLLIERHRKEDFSVRNMSSIIEMATQSQNTLTIMLGAVAAISLLVGGIGVMNIMLVSVTERTKEIGVRMATGARKWDILLQFNTEAAVVCAVGGVLGLLFGYATGLTLMAFGVSIVFTTMPAVLAFSCAFATGLIFGYLPARTAAALSPVVALASE
jgi:macrolide transport system ATP-binding/permease protein